MTVAHIMNTLLQNSDFNWWKYGKPLHHSGMIKIIYFGIIQWSRVKIIQVSSRLKRLDLIDCLKNYGQRFMTLYSDQDHTQEKEVQFSAFWLRLQMVKHLSSMWETWVTVMLNGLPVNEPGSFCHFWACTQVLHFRVLLTLRATPFLLRDTCPQW